MNTGEGLRREGGTNGESTIEIYTLKYAKWPMGICFMTQETHAVAL